MFNRLINNIAAIFKDSPAWAEFTSAFGPFLYCCLLAGGHFFDGKDPNTWPSLNETSEAFNGITLWILITMGVGQFQFGALVAQANRIVRALAAGLMLTWLVVVVFLAWPNVPWSPMLAFPIVLCIPNLFAIFRHARDWGH